VVCRRHVTLPHFPRHRIVAFALTALILVASGCDTSRDNEDPAAKSMRLRTEVGKSLSQHDNLHAEQLLEELLPLDQSLQQWDRLAEDQLNAAKVQVPLGLFSEALENFTAALNHYRQVGDHATEIRTMNGIAGVYIGLGEFEKGIGTLKEALDVSRLASNNESDPETSMNLGDAYLLTGQNELALNQFMSALAVFNKRKYPPAIVRALSRVGYAYAKLGRRDEALGTFSTVETMVSAVANVLVKASFDYDRGKAFEPLGEWNSAAQSFLEGIATLEGIPNREQNEQTNDQLIKLYTALGRVYAHNFAFALAKQSYIEAYTRAKDAGRKIAIGYLLIAIADCERKISAVNPEQEATIAASTLYEQAIALFSRIGNVSGEAYANFRLGAFKENEGNIDAALGFYRRSFELIEGQRGEFRNWADNGEFFGLRTEGVSSEIPFAGDTYWYKPLVVLLARQGRAEEALWTYEQGKMKLIDMQLRSFPFEFKNNALQNAEVAIDQKFEDEGIAEAAAAFQKGLNADEKEGERIEATDREIETMKSELLSTGGELSQKYPSLEPLFRSPTLQEADLRTALPYGTTILDYLIADDRIIIFVVSFDGMGREMPVNVVEVPAYKDIVLDKVRNLDLMLTEHIHSIGTGYSETTDIERLTEELYNYFLRPVEQLFLQHVIIIPPKEMDEIPFHAFTRSTSEGVKPLSEIVDVSYLPYLAAIKSLQSPPRFINAVVAIGNPRGNNWPLDFELRDIRSFFRGATVSVSQNANKDRLFESTGDVLQLSTDFTTDTLFPGRSTFVLSSGSITDPDAHIPVADLVRLHPFPIVYLSDERSSESGLTPLHAALLMMNGTSNVILTFKPVESKAGKLFSEKFYSALANGSNVNDAFRSATGAMSSSQEFGAPYEWSQFFRYGK